MGGGASTNSAEPFPTCRQSSIRTTALRRLSRLRGTSWVRSGRAARSGTRSATHSPDNDGHPHAGRTTGLKQNEGYRRATTPGGGGLMAMKSTAVTALFLALILPVHAF